MKLLKYSALILGAFLAALAIGEPACAQDNPVAPVRETDVIKPQAVCPAPVPVPVSFLAPICEMVGSIIRARGGLTFVKGKERLTADVADYNKDTEIGTARNVFFTTCSALRPDWHITAKEVTLLPSHRLRAKNVSLYVGNLRVLMLPVMNMRVGGPASTASVFPRPGYDSRDGVTLAQTLRLTDTTHSRTTADMRFTTKHSIQGELASTYGVGGRLVSFPGRYLTYGSMRSRALDEPQPLAEDCDPQSLRPNDPARLRPYARFTLRQRTYDAQKLGLVVYRQPEVGVAYIGGQLSATRGRLDPRIELYPQITASWGQFKEVPGDTGFIRRSQIAVQGSFNSVWLGPRTSIQPVGIATYATYQNGDFFRTWGFGVDVAHLSRNGSYYSARYISRTSSGTTPFLFDNIDINKEADLAVQTRVGKNVVGLAVNYDAQRGSLFDWEVMYGRRTDCLGTYVRWDNRFQRFSFDVVLINL